MNVLVSQLWPFEEYYCPSMNISTTREYLVGVFSCMFDFCRQLADLAKVSRSAVILAAQGVSCHDL